MAEHAPHELESAEGLQFPLEEYARRHEQVARRMQELIIDALLVFKYSNVRYLTGFHTFTWNTLPAIVFRDEVELFLPDDEVPLALVRSCADGITHYERTEIGHTLLASYLRSKLPARSTVGVDLGDASTPAVAIEALKSQRLDVADAGPIVERCRLVLSPAEQSCMRLAAEHTARGLRAAVTAAGMPDATDSNVASATFAALVDKSDSLARGQVAVAAGWRSGLTHASWENLPLDRDVPVFLEFAGSRHGYCAPIIRTLMVGEPSDVVRTADHAARVALKTVIKHLRPGVRASDVARAGLKAIEPLPRGVFFHENFGYPVGMGQRTTWMDGAPFHVVLGNDNQIRSGMVFHIPASVIVVGRAGVGHSHTVIVHDDGLELITSACGQPELISVGTK
jgi:Xaa-Pro dipeptidase